MKSNDIQYEQRLNGAKAVATTDASSYVIDVPAIYGGGNNYTANRGDSVILTGYYVVRGTAWYMQTTQGIWVWSLTGNGNTTWQLTEGKALQNHSQQEAQKLVNTIIRCNQRIISNNLLCARFANKLSTTQRRQLYDLQTRLTTRNQELLDNGMVTDVKTKYPSGYVYLQQYLDNFMANGGVGIATIYIVVAAIVIASLSSAAYFAYKYYATEAEKDVKFSDDLTRTLVSKLTEEEYRQLLTETKGLLTKSKIKSALSNYSSVIGIALIAFGGLFIYKKAKQL